mmetsp:Transcript_25229/g.40962  ORF Transcript_25229/g.40962 Transcript_25229/m.40962 type:complete len:210 (+) Transcript_25229:250-879(+)
MFYLCAVTSNPVLKLIGTAAEPRKHLSAFALQAVPQHPQSPPTNAFYREVAIPLLLSYVPSAGGQMALPPVMMLLIMVMQPFGQSRVWLKAVQFLVTSVGPFSCRAWGDDSRCVRVQVLLQQASRPLAILVASGATGHALAPRPSQVAATGHAPLRPAAPAVEALAARFHQLVQRGAALDTFRLFVGLRERNHHAGLAAPPNVIQRILR